MEGQHIDAVLSSPYQRAVDTVIPLAEQNGLSVQTIDEFREHETALDALSDEDYFREIQRYWTDLSHKIGSDESLAQVQSRNIHALEHFLAKYSGKAIAIGTHGMALSTIIHYYDPSFGYKEFVSIAKIKPWLVRMTFQANNAFVWNQSTCFTRTGDIFLRAFIFYKQTGKENIDSLSLFSVFSLLVHLTITPPELDAHFSAQASSCRY